MKPIYLYHLIQDGVIRYVGVTTNITNRKSHHKRNKPPHTFEIVDTFIDKEEAGIAEQYHIAGYNTFKDGWNNSDGGETLLSGKDHPAYIDGRSLDMKAYRQRPEYQAKQRKYNKKYRQTPEYKAYMKEYNKMYKATPESKAKAKEYEERLEVKAMRKKTQRAYYLKNIERIKEYTQTPEYKARRKTPEHRAYMREYMKERELTPEQIARKKAYNKAYKQTPKYKKYMKEYRARKKELANE